MHFKKKRISGETVRTEAVTTPMPATSDIIRAIMTPLRKNENIDSELLNTVPILFGEGGHALTQLASDLEWRLEWEKRFTDCLAARRQAIEDRAIIRFEAYTAFGLTSLSAPLINGVQVRDEVLKELRLQSVDGVLATLPCIVRHSKAGESYLITRVRGFGILDIDSEGTPETIKKRLSMGTSVIHPLGIPAWRITASSYSKLTEIISWMNAIILSPYEVAKSSEKAAQLKITRQEYTELEAVRMLGHLCLHRVSETITGIGPLGKAMVSQTQSKLISWHRGRREIGTVLQGDFDPWAFTVKIERQVDPNCLPMRFDRSMIGIGMSRPSKARKATEKHSPAAIRKRISGQGPRMKPKRAAAKEPDA